MIERSSKSLKDGNFTWLVSVAAADLFIFLLVLAPSVVKTWAEPASMLRIIVAALLPVVVLFLVNLISPKAKASLIFWKGKHALPGHEAFSRHAASDPRIDLAALQQAVGAFPTDPAVQNTTWYRLYREVESAPSVKDPHRHFLLFRDIAAMSALLLIAAPGLLLLSGTSGAAVIAAAIMLCQYAAAAIAAQHNAIRFVKNVLAIHASKAATGGSQKVIVTR